MQNNLYYQDEYVRQKFNFRMLGRLIRQAARHKKMLVCSLLIEIVTGALSLVPGLLYSVIISAIFPTSGVLAEGYLKTVLLAAGGLLATWAGTALFAFLENLVPKRFGHLFSSELRTEIFNHVTVLSFRYFDTHSTGKILVRVTTYVDEIAEIVGNLFYILLYCVGVVLIGIVWILCLDVRIGGAVVGALLPLVVLIYFLSRTIHNREGRQRNKNANYTAFVAESIGGAEVVRAYNRSALNVRVAGELYEEYRKAFMYTTAARESFYPIAHGFSNALLTGMVYGVALAIGLSGGNLSLGTVIAIGSALGEVTSVIGAVCGELADLFKLTANVERIYDTIATPVEICDEEGALPLEECRGEVEFDHVDFSYVEGIPVLKDFSLRARAGETIALVGATGSGKTTIVNLLSRFYDVQGGSVKVDGKDVRAYTLKSLRERVGAMMQDTYIFSGTVLENIRFARPEATDAECIAAAKAACADAFISRLPEGYGTQISENSALSGGERQLLSFARLILADPRVIVLDEATSHIDTQTEREVQASLKALLAGRTSFVIAHRLSTIRGADRIVVLSEGQIVEQGTHQELVERKGAYYRMLAAQG